MDLLHKRLFLLDMDGTLYLGDRLFDGTVDFLARVKAMDGRALFLTNNSSHSAETYVDKLARLGIAAAPADFLTSTQATIAYLRQELPGRLCYALGTAAFRRELALAGIHVTDQLQDDVEALVMGYDTELTYRKLEDACRLLGRDVPYIATNPDWVCPTDFGYVPDCGSISEALYRATGRRPYVIGKPQPDMVTMALAMTGRTAAEAVLIGDRLYTDIACGSRAGIDTILVLSGESTLADVEASEQRPTAIYPDIRAVERALAGAVVAD